jgi:hypothetical protein
MSPGHDPTGDLPATRVTPDARERVVAVLTRHFAEDRLSEAELEARLERVYHATSHEELERVVADLEPPLPALAPKPGARAVEPPPRIDALLSGQEQRLTGVVPRDLRVRSRLGYVELDLTRATFAAGLTTIDVRTFMGYAQIRLPAGVRVDCRGRALAGYFSVRGMSREGGEEAAATVRITGRAALGFAEVLVAKPRAGQLPDRTD